MTAVVSTQHPELICQAVLTRAAAVMNTKCVFYLVYIRTESEKSMREKLEEKKRM